MRLVSKVSLGIGVLFAAACGGGSSMSSTTPTPSGGMMARNAVIAAPSPDPRVGLKAGLQDAGDAIWNLRKVGHAPSPAGFENTNSDLGFHGTHVIQGNYNGFQIWDISNPGMPKLLVGKLCPASQSDVSVYQNLLFVSAEAPTARLDCGATAPQGVVSKERIRGIRIFDITDINNPKYLTNVQSCRGSHTHTVVHDPKDAANVYIYISGTSGIRPSAEMAGCEPDPRAANTALFNIEIVKVPLAHPEQAALVSHARIFQTDKGELANARGSHGASPADTAGGRGGRGGRGNFVAVQPSPTVFVKPAAGGMSGQIVEIRGLVGAPNAGGGGRGANANPPTPSTRADSMAYQKSADSLRAAGFTGMTGGGGGRGGRGGGASAAGPTPEDSLRIWSAFALSKVGGLTATSTKADTARWIKSTDSLRAKGFASIPYPPQPRGTLTQCHDITVYPAVGLAGGACAGMGLLLDIKDVPNPRRIDAYADTNFSFWHSATFSNDGSMVLFSDEWGGGGAAYCRAADPKEWGADAIFKIVNGKMIFQSYYKLPAPQTQEENCVAHNGTLIPIPGRTIMVQAFYQGGLTIFEWTDPVHPKEIAFFDRGPLPPGGGGGFWSAYWYNGHIIGSEMKRGLDIFELTPSAAISQNEIDAAKSVKMNFMNAQDQPKFVWPATFALSRAYVDQLERGGGMAAGTIASTRTALTAAERMSGSARSSALSKLASQLRSDAKTASDRWKADVLASSVADLSKM